MGNKLFTLKFAVRPGIVLKCLVNFLQRYD